MQRLWTISWLDIYRTFTDRTALLMNIAAPLAISLIIGAALGGGSGDLTIQEAEVGILNQDNGTLGAIYPCILIEDLAPAIQNTCAQVVPPSDEDDIQPSGIAKFIDASFIENEAEGRRQVDNGDLDVLIIIPSDFSQKTFTGQQSPLTLYYNAGGGVPSDVARSIIDGITTNLNTGVIATQVIPDYVRATYPDTSAEDLAMLTGQVQGLAFAGPAGEIIHLERVDVTGKTTEFQALQYFAPGMAIFFLTFGMAAGAQSILLDRRAWTMQRIMTTPTSPTTYLGGKMFGTYVSGLFQMIILVFATSFVSNVILGSDVAIWGDNILAIILVILAVVAAAAGLGMVIAAIGRTPEQVDAASTLILVVLGLMGGSFIPVDNVPIVNQISKLTLNHWALNAFVGLSTEGWGIPDILPNIGFLLLMAVIFFGIAITLFKRQMDY